MHERERHVDLIALEHHFKEPLEPCYDRDAGEGLEVVVDRGELRRPLTMQVFPDTGIARIRTPLTDVTLRHARVEQHDERSDALWLTGTTQEEWARVMVQPDGGVVLASFPNNKEASDALLPRSMAQERQEGPSTSGLPEGARSDREEEPARVVYTAPESPSSPSPSPSSTEVPNKIEQERMTLSGRVGVEPRFRTTKNDKLVCSFPLAVHEDDGKTTWHDVVTFGERALKLQGALHKGHEVEVVGYVHVQQVPGRDGKPKEKREIWAAAVKSPRA